MARNVYAWTEVAPNYPAYVSLNQDEDGTYRLSVRSSGNQDSQTIRLTSIQLAELGNKILMENRRYG